MFETKDYKAAAAEFVATALFVWVGCGSAVSVQTQQAAGAPVSNDFIIVVSTAFGLAISVLAYAIAPVSGGHINPAVTLSFALMRKMSLPVMGLYWFAQCLGAVLGASFLWACLRPDTPGGDAPFALGSNFVSNQFINQGSAFCIEMIGTFLLVFTVLMTAVSPRNIAGNLAPVAIGWSVLLAHIVLIPFTGCGINPARTVGPHIVYAMSGGDVSQEGWWVYYVAPFVGSACATAVGMFVFDVHKDDTETEDEPAAAKEVEDVKEMEGVPEEAE